MAKRTTGKDDAKRGSSGSRGEQRSASRSGGVKKRVAKPKTQKPARRSGQKPPASPCQPAARKPKLPPSSTDVKPKLTATERDKQVVVTGVPRPSPDAETPTSHDPIQFPEQAVVGRTTYLTDEELSEFRDLLLRKRSELAGDVQRLTNEALDSRGDGRCEHSVMPIHMADLGSDNWEQEFTLGLIANEQALVREIDQALDRIDARTYGMCLATGGKISKARLRATPWAKYCIEYARAREEGRAL